ncbi:UBX domain-containing protein 4 isoform 3-T3 [Syngnathus typhle]
MSVTFTMIWFSGSIPDAINLAKQRKFVFVIVITGNDEQSANLIASWEDDSVAETAQKCCVAIKIDAESETCVQFSQIYPVVCVPSSFFIGENGVPLEVIAGSVSAEELRIRIDQVRQMHAEKIGTRMGSQETATTLMTSPTQPTMAALSAPSVPVISPEELIRPSALEDIDPREAAIAACRQSAVTTAASEYPHPTNVSFISEANPDMKRHRRKTTLENEDCVDRAALHSKTLEHKAQQITLQAKQTELEAVKGTFVKPRGKLETAIATFPWPPCFREGNSPMKTLIRLYWSWDFLQVHPLYFCLVAGLLALLSHPPVESTTRTIKKLFCPVSVVCQPSNAF